MSKIFCNFFFLTDSCRQFDPAYMGMDSGDMEYPNGSELGEIFAALESLKQELQVCPPKVFTDLNYFIDDERTNGY